MSKRLGRGLDVFLSEPSEEQLFRNAVELEERGDWLMAFHLYMRVINMGGSYKVKALNNAAAILAEHGFLDRAIEFLEEALLMDPTNDQIKENLKALKEE
ncbi:MAG: hypothetical protein H5T93_02690 [Pseudothermotoga sp.]|uniref:tetratricopeptide repeat protein n=1 Tax=Pseudothermotoga sp. TaxID=2033661 RepID=UPI000E86F933|nr:hypothetical protein [Pseudothermotoga sp.]HBT38886.1 hypothetical protein [Pseudothermotoga sp.]HCO97865.1 hypothetical protein [Pseudothermotoga sp.]